MDVRSAASLATFVGRAAEMEVLRRAFDDAGAGRGRSVFLSGEAGIGKTRTAEELATYAQSHAAQVLWGRCYEGDGAPAFWPWVQILRAALRDLDHEALSTALGSGASDIAHLLPELRERLPQLPSPVVVDSPQARFRMFDHIARFLERLTRRAPLVLIIDDIHGADPSSLRLIEFVAREVGAAPLMLLGCYRDGVEPSTHPLRQMLVEVLRLPAAQRLTFPGLSVSEVARFLELSAGAPPAAAVATAIHQRTEGNPLFVTEYVRLLLSVRDQSAISNAESVVSMPVPDGIRAMIGQRVAPLSKPCTDALAVAAVVGREFDREIVEAVLQAEAPQSDNRAAVLHALDEAEAARIVSRWSEQRGRYRFTHALIREALYAEMRTVQRLQLHRQVGNALETLPDRAAHLPELAYHFFEAGREGDSTKAVAYACQAGDRAMAVLAYEEAVRLYQLALGLLERPGVADAAARCAVVVDLGIAQREAGDLETSKTTLLRAAELAKRLGRRDELARAALHYGTKVVWGVFPDPALLQLLEGATAAWQVTDSPLHTRLLARLVVALQVSGDSERQADVGRRAVEMARRLEDAALIAETLGAWLTVHWRPDTLEERAAMAREMAFRAEQAHAVDLVYLGKAWCWMTLMEKGELSAASAMGRAVEALLVTLRDPMHRWLAVCQRAALSIQEGRFAEAGALAQESLTLEQAVNSGPPLGSFAMILALWLAQGRREVLETMLESQRTALAMAPPLIRQSTIACIARELNRAAEARVEFEQLAARQFRDVPYDHLWLMLMQRFAEVCAFLNDLPRAEQLIELLSAYETRVVVNPVTKGYLGPLSHSLALLEASLSRWEAAIAHFEHAIAKHVEMGARPALARTQYEYARMRLARGQSDDQQRARALLDAALATARELDMPLLIERLEALGDVPRVAPESASDTRRPTDAVFRRDGDYFTIAYAGHAVRLKDGRGLQYLAHLLRHPGQEVLAIDLAAQSGLRNADGGIEATNPSPIRTAQSAIGALDDQAKAAYKQRLEELRDELSEAEAHNDRGQAERARTEMEMLAAHLSGALGLGGRDRPAGSDLERARSAVGKRIRAEIKRIRSAHPVLGRHLLATISTGYFCSYQPERDVVVTWEL